MRNVKEANNFRKNAIIKHCVLRNSDIVIMPKLDNITCRFHIQSKSDVPALINKHVHNS